MRRWLCTLSLLACFASGASAATLTYQATLNGRTQSPPNTSPGIGTATLLIDTEANTMLLQVRFSGLASPSSTAHIHCCFLPPTTIGTAVGSTGFPTGVTQNTFAARYDLGDASIYHPTFLQATGGTAADAAVRLLMGLASGEAYYDVHTNASRTSGEIRGYFALPEPALAVLFGAAGAVALAVRRSAIRR